MDSRRGVDRVPVDLAVLQRHPRCDVFLELEILDVQLHDSLAQHADPILRVSADGHVADIEIRLDPRAFERIDVACELQRAQQEFIPHFFDPDDDLRLLRYGDQLADLPLRPLPSLRVTDIGVDDSRDQQHRVRAPHFRVGDTGAHSLQALLHHRRIGRR